MKSIKVTSILAVVFIFLGALRSEAQSCHVCMFDNTVHAECYQCDWTPDWDGQSGSSAGHWSCPGLADIYSRGAYAMYSSCYATEECQNGQYGPCQFHCVTQGFGCGQFMVRWKPLERMTIQMASCQTQAKSRS